MFDNARLGYELMVKLNFTFDFELYFCTLDLKGVFMGFLRWLGGIVVFFWLLGLFFKIGGGLIHILLVVAAIVFIVDYLKGKVS